MTNSKGSPVVVGGATSAEQVVQNAAVSDESLSREVLKTVAELLKNPAAEHSRG